MKFGSYVFGLDCYHVSVKVTAAPLLMEENQKHVEPRVSDVHEAHVHESKHDKIL